MDIYIYIYMHPFTRAISNIDGRDSLVFSHLHQIIHPHIHTHTYIHTHKYAHT